MVPHFMVKARRFGRLLHVILIALPALLTGCDREVAWRGIGTDDKDVGSSTRQDQPGGQDNDAEAR
jgi:hypothetical protein